MKADTIDSDRPNVVRTPTFYADLNFTLHATGSEAGIPVNILPKLANGQRPNVIDLMKNNVHGPRHQHPQRHKPPRG